VAGVLENLKAELRYARDNYDAVSKQFEFGLANSLDVMDANNLLVTSERQLANAQYDYELAILQLRRATGTLLSSVTSKR
jgi:outer membrane protein